MLPAEQALERLRSGNERFASGRPDADADPARRASLTEGQEPFAVILGCSDSRVPAEIVFDQGLGDLFVIRVAGNVVAPSQIGSIEFAAERFGTRLVVVLGHTSCGAVEATLEQLARPAADQSPNLKAIVDRIAPSVTDLIASGLEGDALMDAAVKAHVARAVEQLSHGSKILEDLIGRGDLTIVGAEYSLETGRVTFL